MNRQVWIMTGMMLCFAASLPRASLAAAGNTANLTLTLTMEQSTCDVGLLTPATITFPALALNMLNVTGPIVYAGTQTVTVGLTNCAGSARAGATPAIQVTGTTPVADYPILFREDASTAQGNIGFGIRYEPSSGQPGQHMKSGDLISLAEAGSEVTDKNMNFLIDMLRGPAGDSPTSGSLLAKINFQFVYH